MTVVGHEVIAEPMLLAPILDLIERSSENYLASLEYFACDENFLHGLLVVCFLVDDTYKAVCFDVAGYFYEQF